MNDENVKYMKRCYELAISAGKKGYDTFGAVLVHNGKILEEAENTSDYVHRIFGHASIPMKFWRMLSYIPAALPVNGA